MKYELVNHQYSLSITFIVLLRFCPNRERRGLKIKHFAHIIKVWTEFAHSVTKMML